MHRRQFSLPDPSPWIAALAPPEQRESLLAWADWLRCFVFLSDKAWNERARRQALESVRSGRAPSVPCGAHPGGLVSAEVSIHWFEWAALPAEVRFNDAAWKEHTAPWIHSAASTIGLKGAWRHPHIDAVLMAFFLMMRLDMLHLSDDSLPEMTPGSDLISIEERRKRVWRECVRIRQHLADMLPIAHDLPRSSRSAFKTWWFSSLEWTRLAEGSGENLWNASISFGRASRVHIAWQRWFGKLAFR